jgi:hypothetical protein
MVRRLCITLIDMTSFSNFYLCASGSQGGSEGRPDIISSRRLKKNGLSPTHD